MPRKKNVAAPTIDHINNTIVCPADFLTASGTYGTPEFDVMAKLRSTFPAYKVVKEAKKRPFLKLASVAALMEANFPDKVAQFNSLDNYLSKLDFYGSLAGVNRYGEPKPQEAPQAPKAAKKATSKPEPSTAS